MQRKWIGTGIPIILIALLIIATPIAYYAGQNDSLSTLQQLREQNQKLTQDLAETRAQLQGLTQTLETLKQQLNQTREAIQLMKRELIVPESFFDSDRTGKASVSGGLPHFRVTELWFSPRYDVKEGEIQAFVIWIDGEGIPIKEITATIKTDKDNVTVPLKLVNGTNAKGEWRGFWVVRDIAKQNHTITFHFVNEAGETDTMPISGSATKNP